jgi:hypothetical protein
VELCELQERVDSCRSYAIGITDAADVVAQCERGGEGKGSAD